MLPGSRRPPAARSRRRGARLPLLAATADFLRASGAAISCIVQGRRLFDLTNGWNGRPAAGDHVFVVTHEPPSDWEYADTAPFTFVTDGVAAAIALARDHAGDRDVSLSAGDIGGQALRLGLVDRVVLNLVPAVLESGVPFFRGRRARRAAALRGPAGRRGVAGHPPGLRRTPLSAPPHHAFQTHRDEKRPLRNGGRWDLAPDPRGAQSWDDYRK